MCALESLAVENCNDGYPAGVKSSKRAGQCTIDALANENVGDTGDINARPSIRVVVPSQYATCAAFS